jgi:hypothetical protein
VSAHTPTLFGAALPIPGWPGYLATEDGVIISADSNWRGYGVRQLTGDTDRDGYLKVRLMRDGRRIRKAVHHLVAITWLHPRPSPAHEVRHLNGDCLNNAATNLAWGTRKENAEDRERHGRTSRGERHAAAIRAGKEARHG